MTWTITAVDSRVRHAASETVTDNEKIKAMVVAAYRLAGYRVTVKESASEPDAQISLEDAG